MDCPFCDYASDPDQQVVLENDSCVFLRNPRFQGVLQHAGIIVPKAHRPTVFDLSEQEVVDTHELLRRAQSFLLEESQPQGFSIGWNVGEVGGQDIFHAHLHVIPRYADEPYAGRGIRWLIKQPENRRPGVGGPTRDD